jgi:hypothetical protein
MFASLECGSKTQGGSTGVHFCEGIRPLIAL